MVEWLNKKYGTISAHNKKIIVLEVGGLIRGTFWKVGVGGINPEAYFVPKGNDNTRAKKLGLELETLGQQRRQHSYSRTT